MFFYIKIINILLASINGSICFLNPSLAIRLQQKFYAKINWKIEPINLNKELRNTRIMGMTSMIIAIMLLITLFKK
jgi:hypothetical protein